MWGRVFASTESAPNPDELAERLGALGHVADAKAEADERGWFHIELATECGAIAIDRYLADEGIRDDLNTWAAWLEIHAGAHAERLMQHTISTQQLIVVHLRRPDPPPEAALLLHHVLTCLSRAADGVYQIDGHGFFDECGTLLVAEDAK
jgi:hypothetical protein